MTAKAEIIRSTCPHDCPSTCALEVERLSEREIGRVRGARDNSYTAGVICAKVARYAERVHHPDRLTVPLKRTGPKGSGEFIPISWDEALDEVAARFTEVERQYGSEAVWPYFYAGTMGLVMRDGIERLRHAKRYSGQYSTVCTTLAWEGYKVGTGARHGSDPREMAKSDLVIIWGTNPVHTQVNVMTHATRARKERGAKIVSIDVYDNATAKQADLAIRVRPGTDGALACGIMHVLFRDGHADREYLEAYTDDPQGLEAHLATRTPEWASAICGTPVQEIETLARMIGETPRSFFRLGYGFTRSRNGSVNMHAALSIPAVTGAWKHEGGGALHSNSGIFGWNKAMIEGLDMRDPSIRQLDQSRIGAVLTGDADVLQGGPQVHAMLIQNTNPMVIAPELNKVHEGFAREDLFVCVHEQFMTDTARMADIVLPATTFLEHDDLYQGGGHQHVMLGPRVIEPLAECRSNHEVICALAERLGAEHPGFEMTAAELIDWTLQNSGHGDLENLRREAWIDCQPPFEKAHFIDGFGHPDGRYHFSPDWTSSSMRVHGPDYGDNPPPLFPDHWEAIESPTEEMPFRLVTAPARNYLNSSFTETPSSIKRENRPTALMHPEDLRRCGIADGGRLRLGNDRGTVLLHAEAFEGLHRGVVVVESIWPNSAFEEGIGINALTGADPGAPIGGAAYHDNRIWARPES